MFNFKNTNIMTLFKTIICYRIYFSTVWVIKFTFFNKMKFVFIPSISDELIEIKIFFNKKTSQKTIISKKNQKSFSNFNFIMELNIRNKQCQL